MTDLFIKVDENNVPQNHPVLKNNLKQAFPSQDWESSVPDGWMKFERIESPKLGVYQKYDDPKCTYEIIDGVVKDVWHISDMTDEEKKAKQDKVKANWADNNYFASWVFDETACGFKAPVDEPKDARKMGIVHIWDEEKQAWTEPPYMPPSG